MQINGTIRLNEVLHHWEMKGRFWFISDQRCLVLQFDQPPRSPYPQEKGIARSLSLWLYSLCLWMHPYKMPQQSVVDATAPRHPDDVFWWMFCQQEREWSSGLRRNGEQLNIVLFPSDRKLQQSWLKSSKVPVQAKENIKKKYSTCSEIIDVRRWSTGALSVPLNTE